MSELTASNCGCDNNGRNGSCNILWIIILLSCFCNNNNDGCGCGNNGILGGFFSNDGCGGNNSCDIILILLILNCLGCGSF